MKKHKSGQIIRYIEVKTLTGKWGEGGVAITKNQIEFALEKNDKWWLFIVEGINTESPKNILSLRIPVLEANRFMFDSSWKQLAFKKIKFLK